MSKMLRSSDKSKLTAVMDKVLALKSDLADMPHHSTRTDQLINTLRTAMNTAEKVKSELNPKERTQNPPDRPDTGRGDDDNTESSPPGDDDSDDPPDDDDANGRRRKNNDGQPANHGNPGMSGFPEEKDGAKKQGNKYNVDSDAHRAIARGDDRHVNADTLPGNSKQLGEGHKGPGDDDGKPDDDDGKPGYDDNVSHPFKEGRDTTNTAEPDGTLGYFEKQARQHEQDSKAQDEKDDEERQKVLAEKRDRAQEAAGDSKKYDSENRLSTEAHGHRALKAEQERAEAEQGTDRDARNKRIEDTLKESDKAEDTTQNNAQNNADREARVEKAEIKADNKAMNERVKVGDHYDSEVIRGDQAKAGAKTDHKAQKHK